MTSSPLRSVCAYKFSLVAWHSCLRSNSWWVKCGNGTDTAFHGKYFLYYVQLILLLLLLLLSWRAWCTLLKLIDTHSLYVVQETCKLVQVFAHDSCIKFWLKFVQILIQETFTTNMTDPLHYFLQICAIATWVTAFKVNFKTVEVSIKVLCQEKDCGAKKIVKEFPNKNWCLLSSIGCWIRLINQSCCVGNFIFFGNVF